MSCSERISLAFGQEKPLRNQNDFSVALLSYLPASGSRSAGSEIPLNVYIHFLSLPFSQSPHSPGVSVKSSSSTGQLSSPIGQDKTGIPATAGRSLLWQLGHHQALPYEINVGRIDSQIHLDDALVLGCHPQYPVVHIG